MSSRAQNADWKVSGIIDVFFLWKVYEGDEEIIKVDDNECLTEDKHDATVGDGEWD